MVATVIVSPAILGVVVGIALVGGFIMTIVVRKKYECTPEREKKLEERDKEKGGTSQ